MKSPFAWTYRPFERLSIWTWEYTFPQLLVGHMMSVPIYTSLFVDKRGNQTHLAPASS